MNIKLDKIFIDENKNTINVSWVDEYDKPVVLADGINEYSITTTNFWYIISVYSVVLSLSDIYNALDKAGIAEDYKFDIYNIANFIQKHCHN